MDECCLVKDRVQPRVCRDADADGMWFSQGRSLLIDVSLVDSCKYLAPYDFKATVTRKLFFIVRSRVWKLGVDNFGAGSTTVSGDGHTISVMDSPPQNGYRKCRNTNSFPSISNGLPLRRLWYFRFFHS